MVQPPLISFHLISLYLPAYLSLSPHSISSATAESLSILFFVVSLAPSPVLWHGVDFQYVFVGHIICFINIRNIVIMIIIIKCFTSILGHGRIERPGGLGIRFFNWLEISLETA